MLLLWKTWTYFPDYPEAAYDSKDKWEIKTATQHLYDESHKAES